MLLYNRPITFGPIASFPGFTWETSVHLCWGGLQVWGPYMTSLRLAAGARNGTYMQKSRTSTIVVHYDIWHLELIVNLALNCVPAPVNLLKAAKKTYFKWH